MVSWLCLVTDFDAALRSLGEPPGPSLARWRALVQALDAIADDSPELDSALARVEQTCTDVPDRLRRAPARWLAQRFAGRPQPRLRIARCLELALQGEVPGDRGAWADAVELAELTIVRVFDDRLGDAGLARWLRSPSHAGVRELALASGITDAGARALADDPRLAALDSLALFRNSIGAGGLAALCRRLPATLRRLLLGRNALGEAGMRALADASSRVQLDLLDLDANGLAGAAIEALVEAPLLRGARALNLSNNAIARTGCLALARCEFAALDELFLHGCSLDDEALAPLFEAPWLPRLRNLALSDNALSLHTIRRLAACRELGLRELDICHNPFDVDAATRALRSAPQLAALGRLCV